MSKFSLINSFRESLVIRGYSDIHIWETYDDSDAIQKYILIATEPGSDSTLCEVVTLEEMMEV